MRGKFVYTKAQSKEDAEAREDDADRDELTIKLPRPGFEPTDLRPLWKLSRLLNQLGWGLLVAWACHVATVLV